MKGKGLSNSLNNYIAAMGGSDYRRKKSNPKNVSVSDLIDFYTNIRDDDFRKLNEREFSYLFQDEIVETIRQEIKSKNSKDALMSYNISSYFSLITQAGRLVKTL